VLLVFGAAPGTAWQRRKCPAWSARSEQAAAHRLRCCVFLGFVASPFFTIFACFIEERFHSFFWLVVGHQFAGAGRSLRQGWLLKLPVPDRRGRDLMEVASKNSGWALVILLHFPFPEAGGMMLITAFWGVWHLGFPASPLSQIWRVPHMTNSYSDHRAAGYNFGHQLGKPLAPLSRMLGTAFARANVWPPVQVLDVRDPGLQGA